MLNNIKFFYKPDIILYIEFISNNILVYDNKKKLINDINKYKCSELRLLEKDIHKINTSISIDTEKLILFEDK